MPNSLSVASILEKNRLESDVPFFLLLDIEVVDPNTGIVTEVINIVRNNEDVTVAGVVYSAAMFDVQFGREAGAQASVSATINDYTGALQARLEAYGGGIGFNVTMSIVDGSALSNPPEIAEYFQVLSCSVQDYAVTFQLGAENEVLMTFPRRRQDRDFCSWRYKSAQCGYGVTKLNYLGNTAAGSVGYLYQQFTPPAFDTPITVSAYVVFHRSKTFRMNVFNVTAGTSRSVTFTLNADKTISVSATSGVTGAYAIFQKEVEMSGITMPNTPIAFRVRMTMTLPAGESANTFQLRVYPSPTDTSAAKLGVYFGCPQVEAGSTSTSFQETVLTTGTVNKLVRSTSAYPTTLVNVWTLVSAAYYDSADGEGFGLTYGPNVGALATCDLTLQGTNGCAAHANNLNFGGFPGLQANAYRYA